MFKANSSNVYIAAKSQSVKPDVVSDVGPLNQIRLLVPSFVSFLDPNDTYLKFNLQIQNARGIVVPDKKGGAHSLFRNVIIRDGGNTTSIENIEDYNALACMVRPYTEQSSIRHKRELREGVQHDANNSGTSLYYGRPSNLAGANAGLPNTTRRVSNVVEVYLKLRSGLFSSGGIVPVGLMNGLRLQIDTEDASRALHQPFITGSLEGGLASCHIPNATLVQDVYPVRQAGNVQEASVTLDITTTDAGENNPFAIGDIIYMCKNVAGAVVGEVKLGYITGFYVDGGKLGISFLKQFPSGASGGTAQPVDGSYTKAATHIYYKMADRQNPSLGYFSSTNTATDTADAFEPGVTYNISNVEMLCSSVQPPDAYVQGMMKKAMTAQGVSIDYITSELHRYNQVNNQGLTQIQIPTLAQRAKAVMCQPIPVANYRNLAQSSFSGRPDFARNYQFVKGTELVPSRQVNLERYSQVVAEGGQTKNEPLHTVELQKALTNINEQVYSLQKVADSFAIARSFNKYGQVTNLADDTLSLRVDYGAGGSAKVFNNYIFKLARLTVANGQVMVMG